MLEVIGSGLPLLDLFSLLLLFLFHPDLVIPDTFNGFFQVINFFIFLRIIGIFLIKFINELPKLLLLSLNIDIVAFKVLILLLGEHEVELIVQIADDVVNVVLKLLHLVYACLLNVGRVLVRLWHTARGAAQQV